MTDIITEEDIDELREQIENGFELFYFHEETVEKLITHYQNTRDMYWRRIEDMPEQHEDRFLIFTDNDHEIKTGYKCYATKKIRIHNELGGYTPIAYMYPSFLFKLPIPPTGEAE